MEYDDEKLDEAVKTCLERDVCYWYKGACGLTSGKREHTCPNLDTEVVLKMEFYSSPEGNVAEECFRCRYEKKNI